MIQTGAFVFGGMIEDFTIPTDTLLFDFTARKFSVAQANAPLQGLFHFSFVLTNQADMAILWSMFLELRMHLFLVDLSTMGAQLTSSGRTLEATRLGCN